VTTNAIEPLPLRASADEKRMHHAQLRARLASLLDGEDDWVAAMATVACELHHAFDACDWTGFYRAVSDRLLVVGPYQGGHGCLRIDFSRGVCGAAARTRRTQLVPDVEAFPGHIACSSATRSEIVVPVLTPDGRLLAVLDLDSDAEAAFDPDDQVALEALCADLGRRFARFAVTSQAPAQAVR
jgi:L-methionine (R)-S-oxide reductase